MYILNFLIEIQKSKSHYGINANFHNYNTRRAEQNKRPKFRLTITARSSLPFSIYNKLTAETKNLNVIILNNRVKPYLLENEFYSVTDFCLIF